MLNLIIYHEKAAPYYNAHIDKHLIELIGLNLNLSELFKSEILYHPLRTFDTLSLVKEEELWASKMDNIRDIMTGKA
jgi:hypothetical protein